MELPVRKTEQTNTSSKRTIGFVVVIVVHALMLYALVTGLAKTMVDALLEPIETSVIEEAQQIPEAPPPPPPKFDAPPPVVMDMPDVVITQEAAPSTTIQVTKKVAPPPPPPPADVIIAPRTNPRRPNAGAEEIYPAMSKRLGEEGTVVLLLTVSDEGRVTEAKIDQTSGFERLDEAASKEAVRSWRFLPGTRNGKAETMQMRIKVTFSLKGDK
jgi:periplasmic protein TonB